MPQLSSAADNPHLNAFLAREDVRQAGITLSYVDGFVAAMAAGPGWARIEDVASCLLGRDGPTFESEEETEGVMNAVLERYEECAWTLDEDPSAYAPTFAPDGDVTSWATGFAQGMMLSPRDWEGLINDPDQSIILAPILPFARLPGSGQTTLEESGKANSEDYAYLTRHIREAVLAIADYWWGADGEEVVVPPHANTNEPGRHRKIGRNEPCPCGSGKKYKKCCGG